MTMNISADLQSLFTWNTKQVCNFTNLCVYVLAGIHSCIHFFEYVLCVLQVVFGYTARKFYDNHRFESNCNFHAQN